MTNYTLSAGVGAFDVVDPGTTQLLYTRLPLSAGVGAFDVVDPGATQLLYTRLPLSAGVGVFSVGTGGQAVSRWPSTLTDEAIFGQSTPYTVIYGGGLTDTIKLHEAPALLMTYGPVLADTFELLSQANGGYAAQLSDEIIWSIAVEAVAAYRLVDELIFDGQLVAQGIYSTQLIEELILDDVLGRFFGGTLSDILQLYDNINPQYVATAAFADQIRLSGSLVNQMLFAMIVDDTIQIADVELPQMIFSGDPLLDTLVLQAGYVSPNGNFTTWAINTRTNGVTEYLNYVFNSFCKIGNRYLGANQQGLWWLDGATDGGASIPTLLQGGFFQPNSTQLSGFKAAYLGMDISTNEKQVFLKLVTPTGQEYVYAVQPRNLENSKVNMGKGLRARFFAWELSTLSADYGLHTIEFVPMVASRRV